MSAQPDGGRTDRSALVERILGGPRYLRRREVARAVGISLLSARKLWRALGFAGVTDEVVAFTDADRDALALVVGLVREGVIDEETAIACARALGQTTDRLVSWQTEALMEHIGNQAASGKVVDPLAVIDRLAGEFEDLLIYSWRRQLAAAVSRLAETPEAGTELTVGFADLVSYTRLSQRLEQRDLSVLVQRFEGLASDVVTAGGGRVVKTVGDEVLFVADEPVAAAIIALSISERMSVDDVVPDVRIGLSHGWVLRSLGDVYGPTVNLASRLTALAQPGTVVTDPLTGKHLEDRTDMVLIAQRRRQVRGFGQLQPLLVTPVDNTSTLIHVDWDDRP